MTRLPAKQAYASVLAQGKIRKIAPIKRTIVSKTESSSAKVGHRGCEKWRWDVADEVYATKNSAEKKQIRNRCGARTFRAKKKGISSSLLLIPQMLTVSGGHVKSGKYRIPKTTGDDCKSTGEDPPPSTQRSPHTTGWTPHRPPLISPIGRVRSFIRLSGFRTRYPRSRMSTRVNGISLICILILGF